MLKIVTPKFAVRWSIALLMLGLAGRARSAEPFEIAKPGAAPQPIRISPQASSRTKAAADALAGTLARITGAKFTVEPGDGSAGIVVGTVNDFPDLVHDNRLAGAVITQRENYVLRSSGKWLLLIGATDLAVEHATWDLLYRLGYRQFFPGMHWEVIPHASDLSINVDVLETPSYFQRRIWYGSGLWDYNAEPYKDWCAKNRATSGIALNSGHSYERLVHANQAVFDAHPEYLGLVDGVRKSTKVCVSNPAVPKLMMEHCLRELAKNPDADSISVDPSDGGGWCECAQCAKIGTPTDRAVFLANAVAKGVNEVRPNTLVGMYAYNYHSPPPNIDVDSRVVVSVATAFIRGGASLNDLLAAWGRKVKMMGIREYYSVNTWDRDLPGDARGGNLNYLQRTIPDFYSRGARFMSAESSDNWGPNGLGYYYASRVLWNVNDASSKEALVEDFLTRAFGPAKEPMREFYKQLDGSSPHLVKSDQLGRMFRSLDEARKLADSAEVTARLNDLVLYARYVDLFRQYADAKGTARQAAFEAVIKHAYRMRTSMMVHTKGLYRDLAERDTSVTMPDEATWNAKPGTNPWKSDEPFSKAELADFISKGISRNPLATMDFTPVAFSMDLVRASNLKAGLGPRSTFGAARGTQTYYTLIENAPTQIELAVTGGLIEHYRDRGNVKIALDKVGGASQTGELETRVTEDRSVPPDGKEHAVKLDVLEPGLYRLSVDDGRDRTAVVCRSAIPWTVRSTLDEPINVYHPRQELFFYVPRGTKKVGLFGGPSGEVRDSAGKSILKIPDGELAFSAAAVPPGEDGKVWSIRGAAGAVRLLTVPPLLAPSPGELLFPSEVVAQDHLDR